MTGACTRLGYLPIGAIRPRSADFLLFCLYLFRRWEWPSGPLVLSVSRVVSNHEDPGEWFSCIRNGTCTRMSQSHIRRY